MSNTHSERIPREANEIQKDQMLWLRNPSLVRADLQATVKPELIVEFLPLHREMKEMTKGRRVPQRTDTRLAEKVGKLRGIIGTGIAKLVTVRSTDPSRPYDQYTLIACSSRGAEYAARKQETARYTTSRRWRMRRMRVDWVKLARTAGQSTPTKACHPIWKSSLTLEAPLMQVPEKRPSILVVETCLEINILGSFRSL
ncbi:hypothetical protein BCR34DRAFT_559873 [Clohesyomyces aquaticus]|uniref:Uncharacterized protein n=1 Tax=Clohesyomyces aquaticus TaxID=1231657 RepID=A0A1Y1ZYE1_9PLEO|nr:hypothetical protein BCR34DRAFT_559873 [Clohesyomyces aquaticus]